VSRLTQPRREEHLTVEQLALEVDGILVHLQNIRKHWANALGISVPQWIILTALAELAKDDGVPVKVVSKLMCVDPSFVTTQSKLLEKRGFVFRKTSARDARIVQMSLTDLARKRMAELNPQQEDLNDFIFAGFDTVELNEFINRLGALRIRLEKARVKAAMEL
jgi:MarR family transcriptional regulator, organic hydroperoxide resistance regulator